MGEELSPPTPRRAKTKCKGTGERREIFRYKCSGLVLRPMGREGFQAKARILEGSFDCRLENRLGVRV